MRGVQILKTLDTVISGLHVPVFAYAPKSFYDGKHVMCHIRTAASGFACTVFHYFLLLGTILVFTVKVDGRRGLIRL